MTTNPTARPAFGTVLADQMAIAARLAQTRLTLCPVRLHNCRRKSSSVGLQEATKNRS